MSSVLVSVRVKATAAQTFKAFTEKISAWWDPNPLFRFTPRSPGIVSFQPETGGSLGVGSRFIETRDNGKVFEIGRIEVWEPGRRLVFTWRQATFAPG